MRKLVEDIIMSNRMADTSDEMVEQKFKCWIEGEDLINWSQYETYNVEHKKVIKQNKLM